MGSVIDRIQELAPTMGEFTTRQMASRIYGELTENRIGRVGMKLKRLAAQGYIVKVDTVKAYYSRHQAIWRASE